MQRLIEPPLIDRVLEMAVAIQQVPAPTFMENSRAQFLLECFQTEGLCDVECDDVGNVYARLPGNASEPPLVVSAHTDTVFPAATDLTVSHQKERIAGPGIGDNSTGVAGLFGLVWALRGRAALPGDVWLVANVGEEGLGDLRGMRAVVDRFGAQARAYLILEGMALGQIYHRGLGVKRYRIRVRTSGGHSWVDYGRPSAIHELAILVGKLAGLPLPARPRTTLNVGVIAGGTSVNTIAAESHMDLDLRSEGAEALANLAEQVELLVEMANRSGITASCEVIGERPAGKIAANHPLVSLVKRSLERQGIQPNLTIGSTDANMPLSQGLPAVCLGLTTGGGAHTVQEFIHTQPLRQGLEQLVNVVEGAFQVL